MAAAAMTEAASAFTGRHDFSAFGGADRQPIRTILWIRIRRKGLEVTIDVAADAFLRQMDYLTDRCHDNAPIDPANPVRMADQLFHALQAMRDGLLDENIAIRSEGQAGEGEGEGEARGVGRRWGGPEVP